MNTPILIPCVYREGLGHPASWANGTIIAFIGLGGSGPEAEYHGWTQAIVITEGGQLLGKDLQDVRMPEVFARSLRAEAIGPNVGM